jgi:hypothetical protein
MFNAMKLRVMPTREQIATLAMLISLAAVGTLAIDLLRAPAWHSYEMLWLWWATGPSHYFLF